MPTEAEIKESQEKLEIYEKLLEIPEFKYLIEDSKKIEKSIKEDTNGILGSYFTPGSGCQTIEQYKYTIGYLHGFQRVMNLVNDSILYAKQVLKQK